VLVLPRRAAMPCWPCCSQRARSCHDHARVSRAAYTLPPLPDRLNSASRCAPSCPPSWSGGRRWTAPATTCWRRRSATETSSSPRPTWTSASGGCVGVCGWVCVGVWVGGGIGIGCGGGLACVRVCVYSINCSNIQGCVGRAAVAARLRPRQLNPAALTPRPPLAPTLTSLHPSPRSAGPCGAW
jgi:hypothetical protein